MRFEQHAEILGALELGILPPSGDIKKMLATLSADDAHIAKRKFRKLKRRAIKEHPNRSPLAVIHRQCKKLGEEIIKKS